jgi:dihydrofolate synthase/folylpolyglutamate synthase
MDALAYLESLVQFGQKFGLDTMRHLCASLDHPERAYPTLLVAGTNGKGSVSAYLDHALRASGLRVGRYTSPHLVRVHERLVADGREIDGHELEAVLDRVRAASGPIVPTYFEALTAAAFEWFRQRPVDVAVLEVGMGGRLDATNVSDPLVSAIVSIDFDHQAYLGDTLAAIAREKAGVLRRERVTVLGPLPAEAAAAMAEVAATTGAILRTPGVLPAWCERVPALPGQHQRDNLRVAAGVLEAAREAGLPIDLARAAGGLAHTRWPGRLQWIPGEVPVLLDGAHNPAGARALAAYLRTRPGPFVLLFGAMADKAYAEMAGELFPLAREVVITRPPIARAADPVEILSSARGLTASGVAVPDVAAALAEARTRARGVGPVVVAGSLYLVGAVLAEIEAGR